jgi:hypothetical protein
MDNFEKNDIKPHRIKYYLEGVTHNSKKRKKMWLRCTTGCQRAGSGRVGNGRVGNKRV